MIHTGNKTKLIKDLLKRTGGSLDPSELFMAAHSQRDEVTIRLMIANPRYPIEECVVCESKGAFAWGGSERPCWACDETGILTSEQASVIRRVKEAA